MIMIVISIVRNLVMTEQYNIQCQFLLNEKKNKFFYTHFFIYTKFPSDKYQKGIQSS